MGVDDSPLTGSGISSIIMKGFNSAYYLGVGPGLGNEAKCVWVEQCVCRTDQECV